MSLTTGRQDQYAKSTKISNAGGKIKDKSIHVQLSFFHITIAI